ncbi:peroxidase-like isoform X2 [Daphnia pulicaria]|uniref:peroxidase-like isoform X2 n=1 Tax=Daphnia pulicaria TaxID=35523 RepID=UPI001EEA8CAA|nr:peroxidase-like isoform X2 [Daphnia pulicaria]
MSQKIAASSQRTTSYFLPCLPMSTWLCLVVGLAGLWPFFGCCWTLADASNHQELDPPPAQRLAAATLLQQQQQQPPLTAMLTLIREHQKSERDPNDLSPEQIQLIEHIFGAGLNASDYLINDLEPRLYKEGHIIKKDDPAAGVAAFNYQDSITKEYARYGFATIKAYALLREKFTISQRNRFGEEGRISLRNTDFYAECPLRAETIVCPPFSALYRTGDGTCNNAEHPEWGASFRPFQRFLPAEYGDGVEAFRRSVQGGALPTARTVSALVHRHRNITTSQFTTMVMQWGQFLDHDLTSSSQTRGFNGSIPECCQKDGQGQADKENRHPDCMPIEVSSDDAFYSKYNVTCLNFVRSSPSPSEGCLLGPREQINQITSYLDASNVYGSTDKYLSSLRLYSRGMLKCRDMMFRKALLPVLEKPLNDECRSHSPNMHCFKGGDSRTNEQPGLSSMHTAWMREHNRLVRKLAELNPHWNDERLFHEARKIVGAQMQHISYNEFLPIVLGERVIEVFDLRLKRRGFFYGYNISINPMAANSFGTAAFRFGHSLIPKNLNRCNRFHQLLPYRTLLRKELMDPTPIHNIGAVDRILLGMCSQPAMRRDEYIVDELTNHLFQTSKKPFGMDLMALNIQRARDHGIPPYVVWREACGLTPIHNWGQLLSIMDDDTVGRLRIAYKNLEDIDLFPGAMAEKPVIGGMVGPVFACIIAQQFSNLRLGDRFWYENGDVPNAFTESQLRELRRSSLARIICDNLDDAETVQPWVMLQPDSDTNPRVSCRGGLILQMDLRAWKETEAKATSFHSNLSPEGEFSTNSLKASNNLVYQHTDDYESEAGSPSKGKGSGSMPLLQPEDDWVEELPRPIPMSLTRTQINAEEKEDNE